VTARVRRNLLFAVVTAVVVGAAFLYVTRDSAAPTRVSGLAPVGGNLFADGETIDDATRGILSPDGSNLAVVSPDGLGLVAGNDVRPITEEGTHVVDAAWFGNGATLLVAEGPVPTGLLAIVDVDGKVRGSVPLEPSVGFGTGHGMAVAPGGRAAVVTAVDRPALGPEQHRLVHVDLETGATRDLTPPGGPDEEGPVFLDAGRVAFVETTPGEGGGVRTLVVSVADGSVLDVAAGERVVGATDAGEPVLARSGELVVAGKVVGQVPPGSTVTSVHPASGLGVASERVTSADGSTVIRLRRLQLTPIA
jgi:hypothetical protein